MAATSEVPTSERGVWVTVAARQRGVHPQTLREACHRGEVRHGRIGNRIIIAASEIARILGVAVEPVGPTAA
jgi:hypothetical protein